MGVRTDLAVEFAADRVESDRGITVEKYKEFGVAVSTVTIKNDSAAKELGKPIGRYITLEAEGKINIFELENLKYILVKELRGLLGDIKGTVLVVGIGNKNVTPDAIGPKTAEGVLATRHIPELLAQKIGLKGLKSVSVLSPGVLGQTGIEVKEIIESAVRCVKPALIILVDALAAREVSRLCNTIQISNTGICPGSGVGNERLEISEKTVGIKCVTVGIPTVVHASTLCFDLTGNEGKNHNTLIVTPRDIDRLVDRSCEVVSFALNEVLQPEIDPDIIASVV